MVQPAGFGSGSQGHRPNESMGRSGSHIRMPTGVGLPLCPPPPPPVDGPPEDPPPLGPPAFPCPPVFELPPACPEAVLEAVLKIGGGSVLSPCTRTRVSLKSLSLASWTLHTRPKRVDSRSTGDVVV